MKNVTFFSVFFLFLVSSGTICQVTTFNYTGALQTYTVPAGVTSVQVEMTGGSGGQTDYSGSLPPGFVVGIGGRLQADLTVVPGQVLNIYVGGEGAAATNGVGGTGGFNGGGNGGTTGTYSGGGGGGASDIRIGGTGLADRVMVVGGGGGAAYNYSAGGDDGGNGGDLIGANGESNNNPGDVSCGKGGTQSAGGAFGQWPGYSAGTTGALGIGGNGGAGTSGGGAGGGYYGGGGGSWSGGGGASSYAGPATSNVVHTQGYNTGNGQVIITQTCIGLTTSVSATSLCSSDLLTLSAVSTTGGNVLWDLSVVDNVPFQPDTTGIVTYTAISDNPADCQFAVDINILEAPEFSLSTSDEFGGMDGGVYVTLIAGIFPFTYDWDNDGTGDFDDSQNLINVAGGTYTVVVSHANGCTSAQSATVNSQLGVGNNELNFSVYPNPASDLIFVTYSGEFKYEIVTITGEIISSGNGVNKKEIFLRDFAPGIYIVNIISESGSNSIQLIKE